MNVPLDPATAATLASLVGPDGFDSEGDAVRAAILLLDERRRKIAALRAAMPPDVLAREEAENGPLTLRRAVERDLRRE